MLAKFEPNSPFVSQALAGRKRPRFKRVGMKRAQKKKLDMPQLGVEAEKIIGIGGSDLSRIVVAAAPISTSARGECAAGCLAAGAGCGFIRGGRVRAGRGAYFKRDAQG